MDRAYGDLLRFHRLHRAGAFFITRAKNDLDARRVYSRPRDPANEMTDFDFAATPVNEPLIRDLASSSFPDGTRNIVPVDGTGTGKTHLAIARSCIRKSARCYNAVDLVNLNPVPGRVEVARQSGVEPWGRTVSGINFSRLLQCYPGPVTMKLTIVVALPPMLSVAAVRASSTW